MKKLIKVKNFPDRMYAERAQQTLEEEQIASVVQSLDIGILGAGGAAGFAQGVDLYVEEKDAERAGEILKDIFNNI
jgi:Putative prokaryotic signal transducing protein